MSADTQEQRLQESCEAVSQQLFVLYSYSLPTHTKSASDRACECLCLTSTSLQTAGVETTHTPPTTTAPSLHQKTFILWLCPLQQLTTLWLPDWRLTFLCGGREGLLRIWWDLLWCVIFFSFFFYWTWGLWAATACFVLFTLLTWSQLFHLYVSSALSWVWILRLLGLFCFSCFRPVFVGRCGLMSHQSLGCSVQRPPLWPAAKSFRCRGRLECIRTSPVSFKP